jgi:hypothetical protein
VTKGNAPLVDNYLPNNYSEEFSQLNIQRIRNILEEVKLPSFSERIIFRKCMNF